MIGSNPHADTTLFALEHQGTKSFLDSLELFSVLRVAVLENLESLFVGEISGVDANFFNMIHGLERGLGQRRIVLRRACTR